MATRKFDLGLSRCAWSRAIRRVSRSLLLNVAKVFRDDFGAVFGQDIPASSTAWRETRLPHGNITQHWKAHRTRGYHRQSFRLGPKKKCVIENTPKSIFAHFKFFFFGEKNLEILCFLSHNFFTKFLFRIEGWRSVFEKYIK